VVVLFGVFIFFFFCWMCGGFLWGWFLVVFCVFFGLGAFFGGFWFFGCCFFLCLVPLVISAGFDDSDFPLAERPDRRREFADLKHILPLLLSYPLSIASP